MPFSLIVIFFVDLSLYFHFILIMPMLHDENEDEIPGKEVSVLNKPVKAYYHYFFFHNYYDTNDSAVWLLWWCVFFLSGVLVVLLVLIVLSLLR